MSKRAESMDEFLAIQAKMFRPEDFAHIAELDAAPN